MLLASFRKPSSASVETFTQHVTDLAAAGKLTAIEGTVLCASLSGELNRDSISDQAAEDIMICIQTELEKLRLDQAEKRSLHEEVLAVVKSAQQSA